MISDMMVTEMMKSLMRFLMSSECDQLHKIISMQSDRPIWFQCECSVILYVFYTFMLFYYIE